MSAAVLLAMVVAAGRADAAVTVEAGRFAPLYGLELAQRDVPVPAFRLDRRLVTQGELAAFLAAHPEWKQEKVAPALKDAHYLENLENGLGPKPGFESAPAVDVTWFLAEAFCEANGGRLPTTLEWEYVGAADEKKKDATTDPKFVERILGWYARPSRPEDLKGPGSPKNVYGIEQLHGLVWEWTQDFNGVFVTGDSRSEADAQRSQVCGGGALGAARREDYAAFMRYALRNSLSAKHALGNLGFRCAYDVKKERSP
jgi:formylglycine-generating enzyme required for sulfatase activity